MSIQAVSDFRGTFVQGSRSTLFLKVADLDGNPVNPLSITVSIDNDSAVNVESGTPEKVTDGFYIYDWNIDSSQDMGLYYITWTYETEDGFSEELQSVIVAEDGDSSIGDSLYTGKIADFRFALEKYIMCAQNIPVYFEQGKPSANQRDFSFTFPRWNQSSGVNIYRNGKLIEDVNLEINYFKGKVSFASSIISPYDVINADYNFRWFSDEQLDRFLSNALQSVNIFPPASAYSFENVPDRFVPIILYGAARDALRELMLCLQFQEPQLVFGGPEKASQAFSNMETLKQNYEKDWQLLLEQKKLGPYPRTRAVVVPEFTLPGGRSRWFRYLFNGG